MKNKRHIYGIPYVPHLNIIEKFFHLLKAKIKKTNLSGRSFFPVLFKSIWNKLDDLVLPKIYGNIYSTNLSKELTEFLDA